MTAEFNPQSPENPILTSLQALPDIELAALIAVNETIENDDEYPIPAWCWYSEVGRLARAEQRARESVDHPRPQDSNTLWKLTGNLGRDELTMIFEALTNLHQHSPSEGVRQFTSAIGLMLALNASRRGISRPERYN